MSRKTSAISGRNDPIFTESIGGDTFSVLVSINSEDVLKELLFLKKKFGLNDQKGLISKGR